MASSGRIVVPMVVATGSVLIGGATGGPKAPKSNLGVVAGSFIATFMLLLLNGPQPEIAGGIALIAAVSAVLIYGPSIATAVNRIK